MQSRNEPFDTESTSTQHFRASDHVNDSKIHLLVAASGSVATIKLPQILATLSTHSNLSIRLVLTASATEFLRGQSSEQPHYSALQSLCPNLEGIHLNANEWEPSWTRSAPILHIELRRWADALLIVPLSANMLAKMALGISDDLLSCIVRAWDTTGQIDPVRNGSSDRKRIWIAPAMNTAMWMHPVTGKHLAIIREWSAWVTVLGPIEKGLACGDVGGGAMMEWQDIVAEVEVNLGLPKAIQKDS